MNFETVSELAEQIADWCGIYGACKSDGETGCRFDLQNPVCCRVGFMGGIEDRIREAVKNDERIALWRRRKNERSKFMDKSGVDR